VINNAESVIHDTEKNMQEYKSQLPPEEVTCYVSYPYQYSVILRLRMWKKRLAS